MKVPKKIFDSPEFRKHLKLCLGAALVWALLFLLSFLLPGCVDTVLADEDFTDEEIVVAIYHAEGGGKAQYPYGIRSVSCGSKAECKKVCKNTVHNNRRRFKEYGHKRYVEYIDFLASRYCPVKGANLSAAEKNLNKNWIKNVKLILQKNRTKKES